MARSVVALVVALALAPGCRSATDPATRLARGTVEAREVTVRSEAAGRVVATRCEEGEGVADGDELVRLDRQELEARRLAAEASHDAVLARLDLLRSGSRPQEIAEANTSVDRARAALARASDERARSAELARAGSVPAERLEQAETQLRIARADLGAAEQRLSLVREGARPEEVRTLEANLREADAQSALIGVQLDRATIRAPFAGTVTRRSVEIGDVITPGTPVCTITDLADLKVKVYLPENRLAGISLKQRVEIRPGGQGTPVAGEVRVIASTAEFLPKDIETADDRELRVFAVQIAIAQPAPDIKAGTTVSVAFPPGGGG